jgi:hypothetical protein
VGTGSGRSESDGEVRVESVEGRSISSMDESVGAVGAVGSSGSEAGERASASSSWWTSLDRAKRSGEASRAFWADAASRKMASAMLSAGLWYSYCRSNWVSMETVGEVVSERRGGVHAGT